MASPSLLDFDALIAPLPGDSPGGTPLPYDVRLKLEELRKEINPDDYDEDDPRRPTEYRAPDWHAIVNLASDTLANTSKDLLVAARLTEALTIDKGIPGLRDAIELLVRLVENCWDFVYPPIEEGDTPEIREGPFKWLNEEGYGSRFPMTVRLTPLITVAGQGYNVTDWQNLDRRPAFESAISEVSVEVCQDLLDDLKEARDRLKVLDELLQDKMGEFAPDLTSSENTENLGAAINDCLKIANLIMQRKAGAAPASDEQPDTEEPTTGAAPVIAAAGRPMATRADAYRMLNDAADLLQQIEPHSPIPYLVKRAVKLGELRFPDLMRALIRETSVLDELDRLLGLEPPSSDYES